MARHKQAALIVGVKAKSLPSGVGPIQYFRTLIDALDYQGELPILWNVRLRWINPNAGNIRRWQSGEFSDVLESSNAGFSTVVRDMLEHNLAEQRRKLRRKKPVKIRKR